MQNHIIKRDGLPPIRFNGEEIGSGSTRTHESTRWTNVTLYRTKGGRYIAVVARRTQWDGEQDSRRAGSFATAAEAINYLKGEYETLGLASQEAVDEAAKADEGFAAAWVEEVD